MRVDADVGSGRHAGEHPLLLFVEFLAAPTEKLLSEALDVLGRLAHSDDFRASASAIRRRVSGMP